MYGAEKLKDDEFDSVVAEPEFVRDVANIEQLTSSKLLDMMLVDTESAESLSLAFPELYAVAKTKEEMMNRQANVSGMDKVKHDFFGKKRKAAKAALEDLRSKREALEIKKAFDAAGDSAKEDLRTRKEELEQKKAELERAYEQAGKEDKVQLQYHLTHIGYAIEKVDLELSGNATYNYNPVTSIEILTKTTDVYCKGQALQAEFISGKYVQTQSGKWKQYPANGAYRDLCYFTTALKQQDKADLETMEEAADAVYVMNTGCHANAAYVEVDGKKEQEKASDKDKAEAFHTILGYLRESYREMDDFKNDHPKLFVNKPDTKEVLKNVTAMNEMFKKAQCSHIISDNVVMKKGFYKNISSALIQGGEIIEFEQATHFIAAMSAFLDRSVEWIKSYADYTQGNAEYPGEFDPKNSFVEQYNTWKPQA